MGDVKEVLDTLQHERNRVGASVQIDPPEAVTGGRPHVVFMTPSIDHKVSVGFLASYVKTMVLLSQHGYDCSFQSFGGDPYLSKVRNLCVSTCLRRFPEATHLFFLDADLEWEAEAAVRLVLRDVDIIAGIYCKKNDTPEFPSSLMADKETGEFLEKDGLIRAVMVPTGFLCVKREVYAEMARHSKRYKDSMGKDTVCWNIYEMGFAEEPQPDGMDGQWWGEDCAWGRKATQMGYDMLVDPDIRFGHMGTKTWKHYYGDYVQAYRDGKAKVVDITLPGSTGDRIVSVQALAAE